MLSGGTRPVLMRHHQQPAGIGIGIFPILRRRNLPVYISAPYRNPITPFKRRHQTSHMLPLWPPDPVTCLPDIMISSTLFVFEPTSHGLRSICIHATLYQEIQVERSPWLVGS